MPILMKNARVVMDNIAALAMYEGASKAFVKTYTVDAAGKATLELGASVSDVVGQLNHDVIRMSSKEMINNTESYVLSDKKTNVVVRAKIAGLMGGKYHLLTSENGMDDLLEDKKFLDRFVKGISAQELRDNRVVSLYRHNIETIDNALTIEKSSGNLKVEGEGDLEVSFLLGEQFGADVKLSGEGVKMFTKLPNQVDSGDVYGRYAFATYKLAYNAQVINSKAIYAIVTQPSTLATVTGTKLTASTSFPTV